jgi:hypothetical protein
MLSLPLSYNHADKLRKRLNLLFKVSQYKKLPPSSYEALIYLLQTTTFDNIKTLIINKFLLG